ncbi:MAG: hypothetical protein AAGC92_10230 [Pseudomonadota bacterium]
MTRKKPINRRAALQMAAGWGVVGLAVAGGGYWLVDGMLANAAEQDLSRIGNGTPSVVQIHDPSCSLCRQLQRATRTALAAFENGDLTYVVANITTPEGRALANRHGVGNVTLLLFDGAGRMRTVVRGTQSPDALIATFSAHLKASRAVAS